MPHPGKKITELDEESVPLDASDIAVIVVDVPAAPVTRKTALGTLRRFMLGIATIGTVTIPEAVVIDGSVTAPSFIGNASTASGWETGRLLTIGASGKSVDGSANVSWSLGEIGAAAAAHTHAFSDLTGLPTSLAGYGITDGVSTGGSYANPAWLTALAFTKLTFSGLTTGTVLRATGATTVAFGAVDLANASAVTGTLAVARGGTGIASYTTGNYVRAASASALEQRTPAQVLADIGAVTTSRTLTIAGTTGRLTSSAGAQSLAANRTWTLDLATSGVSAGTYGGATTVPVLTVDVYGRITAASTVGVSVDGSMLTGIVEVANGGTGIGAPTALRYLRSNAAGTAYEYRTAADIVVEGGGFLSSGNLPFSQVTGLPTSLAGYGITDGVSTSGSYANPAWLTSLAFTKLTFSGLTTGTVLRATGATTVAFGAVDLANASAVTGTLPNARTTATAVNTASTIVLRDGAGSFSAGQINATFAGSGAALTDLDAGAVATGILAAARGGTGRGAGYTAGNYIRAGSATVLEERTPAQVLSDIGALSAVGNIDFSQVTGLPTSLAGYGITDGVSTGGSYSNPAWLTALAATKLTGTVDSARLSGSYTGITAVGTLTTVTTSSWVSVGGTLYLNGVGTAARVRRVASADNADDLGIWYSGGLYYLASWSGSNGLRIDASTGNVFASGAVYSDGAGFYSYNSTLASQRKLADSLGYYNRIFRQDGTVGIYLGGASDPANYYDNGTHFFRDASGSPRTSITSLGVGVTPGLNILFDEGSGAAYATMFRQASSAALVLANGYRFSATANGFASSTGVSWARAAIAIRNGDIVFYTNTASTVSAGTDITPTQRLIVNSDGTIVAAGTIAASNWILSSDLRLKSRITPLSGGLAAVREVPAIQYWHDKHKQWELGFGAQDWLRTGFGDRVTTVGDDGYLGMFYDRTIPVLWAAVREQDTEVEILRRRVRTLEARIAAREGAN